MKKNTRLVIHANDCMMMEEKTKKIFFLPPGEENTFYIAFTRFRGEKYIKIPICYLGQKKKGIKRRVNLKDEFSFFSSLSFNEFRYKRRNRQEILYIIEQKFLGCSC